jgi:UrcA family protein
VYWKNIALPQPLQGVIVKSKRHLLIGLTALAAALTANLASAAPAEGEVKTLVVRYSDLDLSQPKDAHRLYVRIQHAARLVCDNFPTSDLARLAIYERCMKNAISNAVSQVREKEPQSLYARFGS